MIRKQVVFKPKKEITLQYNYNYQVMKNIYYYLTVADSVLSRRIHNKGHRVDTGHIYKLFNFTLLFGNARFKQNGILCNENTTIKLIISGKKEIVEKVTKGLLHVKKMKLDNEELILKDIQNDKKVFWKDIMLYSSLSPLVESTKNDDGKIEYLSPYQSDYYKNLAENAKRKYELIYGKKYEGQIFFDIDNAINIKEKYIKIKNGGVKGYEYDIWVEADKSMQKVMYYLGLGQNSSTGMGCLNFVTGVSKNE